MKELTKWQKGLLYLLYALLVLMVVFSFISLKNRGKEGFDRCIQWKCEKGGQDYCSKLREVNNCCLGAGGETVATESGYTCHFS